MSKCELPGEGGGVCARPPRRLFGFEAVLSVGEITDASDDDIGDTGVLSPWDRLTLFEGCCNVSLVGVDLEGER